MKFVVCVRRFDGKHIVAPLCRHEISVNRSLMVKVGHKTFWGWPIAFKFWPVWQTILKVGNPHIYVIVPIYIYQRRGVAARGVFLSYSKYLRKSYLNCCLKFSVINFFISFNKMLKYFNKYQLFFASGLQH